MTEAWAGVWPAALTMFDATGAFDEDATAEHLNWLIDSGVHGLVVGGTSGEFVAMTDAERRRLTEVALDTAAGRVPVIAGTGSYATAATISLTRHAAAEGAVGALVVLPYFQRPSPPEILDHYRMVAVAAGLPLLVYNIPANAAADAVSVADLGRLYHEGVIHGVKNTGPNVHQVNELRTALDDGFRVFYGGTAAPLEGLAGGAHAWVSGILNVIPAAAVDLWSAMDAGDLATARTVWSRLMPYRQLVTRPAVTGVSDLALYRALLRLWGRPAGHCRLPLRDLDAAELKVLETFVA